MIGSRSMSIKRKIVVGITFAVIASTSLVGFIAQNQSRDVLEHRLVDIELPSMLDLVGVQIDGEVSQMLAAAEQLASNQFIHEAIKTTDREPESEAMLVKQLNIVRDQYGLNDASVANRNTAYYWNQGGFLRELNQQQDGWFFGFTQSGQKTSVSIFQEENGDVKMFSNFQQVNGLAMSGLSKSLTDMVNLLNSFQIEKSGYVYLVNAEGKVQIHKQAGKRKDSLTSLYGGETSALLNKSDFNLITAQDNGQEVFVATRYIPSMDWFVVAQVPVDEVFADLNATAQKMLLTTLAVAGAFIFLGLILAGSITRPIQVISERFRELGEGDGDLSQRIPINGNDELAKLSEGFNGFIEKIHGSVKEVAETSHALQIAAQGVSEKSHSTHNNSQNQRDQTIQVVTAINEMGATISEIATNAATAAETASGAESNTEEGRAVVFKAKDAISRLSSDIDHIGSVVQKLAGTTQDIGSILDVIRDISDQTNLLALNAAIEAARAGEQGRGFAVVADEVRNLASRTASSTEEIQKMINQLQGDAQNAVDAMEAGKAVTQEGVVSTDQAVGVLAQISESISDISDRNTQVATATEEQSTVVHTINENIEEINSINEMTTNTAQELADASNELQELSRRLDAMVGGFKL